MQKKRCWDAAEMPLGQEVIAAQARAARRSGGAFVTEDQALGAAGRYARQSDKPRYVFLKRGRWMIGTRPGKRGGLMQSRVMPDCRVSDFIFEEAIDTYSMLAARRAARRRAQRFA